MINQILYPLNPPKGSPYIRELMAGMPVSARRDDIKIADATINQVISAGLWTNSEQLIYHGTGTIPLVIDGEYNFIVGYDSTGKMYPGNHTTLPFPDPQRFGINNNGQSLGSGEFAQPPITTDPVEHHETFGSGITSTEPGNTYLGTQTSPGTSTVRTTLYEDGLGVAGSTNSGETPLSSACAEFSRRALSQNGIVSTDLVMFASSSARGGLGIEVIDEGSTWYYATTGQIRQAFARCSERSLTYALRMILFEHGQADALNGMSLADYRDGVENRFLKPLNTLARGLGQRAPVHLLLTQTTYRAVEVGTGIALAQIRMAQENPLIDIATPDWFFSRYGDGLHLINIGSVHLGAYYGRAMKQRLIDHRKPDYMALAHATLQGGQLRLRFRVPVGPIVIDTINLAATFQNGIRCVDNIGDITLSAFSVDSDGVTVLCTPDRSPGAGGRVRIGLDYYGSGYVANRGATHNFRDSTTDTVSIQSTLYPMWHVSVADEVYIT